MNVSEIAAKITASGTPPAEKLALFAQLAGNVDALASLPLPAMTAIMAAVAPAQSAMSAKIREKQDAERSAFSAVVDSVKKLFSAPGAKAGELLVKGGIALPTRLVISVEIAADGTCATLVELRGASGTGEPAKRRGRPPKVKDGNGATPTPAK